MPSDPYNTRARKSVEAELDALRAAICCTPDEHSAFDWAVGLGGVYTGTPNMLTMFLHDLGVQKAGAAANGASWTVEQQLFRFFLRLAHPNYGKPPQEAALSGAGKILLERLSVIDALTP